MFHKSRPHEHDSVLQELSRGIFSFLAPYKITFKLKETWKQYFVVC